MGPLQCRPCLAGQEQINGFPSENGLLYIILSTYYMYIRRPRPLPRQGRRLGPPEVWNLALSVKPSKPSKRLFGSPNPAINSFSWRSSLPVASPQRLQTLQMLFGSPNPAGQGTKAPSIAFSWRSSLPFASPQTLQMPFWPPQPGRPRHQGPINSFFLAFKLPFASPQTLQTLRRPRHQGTINSFFLAFKPAVCQPSNPPNAFLAAPTPQAKAPRPHQ